MTPQAPNICKIDSPTRQVEIDTHTTKPMTTPNARKIDLPVPQIEMDTHSKKPMTTQEQIELEWANLQAEFKRLQPEANCSISRRNGIEVAREIVRELKERASTPNERKIDLQWESIPCQSCEITTQKCLIMAGGGSHAWNYILEWTFDEELFPNVYVERYPFTSRELVKDHTAVTRMNDNIEEIAIVSMIDLNDVLNIENVVPLYNPTIH